MDNFITTTELSQRYRTTPSTIIKYLTNRGFVAQDIVIEAHHCKCWSKEAVECLDKHYKILRSKKICLEDYARELDIDMKTFKEILYTLHINAVKQTDRNPLIEEAVLNYKKQEQLQINIKEHPLVTDKRCFKLSWWPNVIPKCFEDLDEDII